ncbi:hypothetical protein [Corynebacterium marinum]|nr:hypothetical protein [Corynebacterium marinum]
MRKNIAVLASVVLALGLAGCGSPDTAETETATSTATFTTTTSSKTSTTSSSSSTASAISEKSTTESVEPSPEPAYAAEVPTTAEAAPQGIWSETGVGYRCGATDAWVYDPANCTAANLGGDPSYDQLWGPAAAVSAEEFYNSLNSPAPTEQYVDPATVPIADGGACPAYLCGYGHDENGNPNPSSGEIQGWWMDCIAVNTEDYCRANDPYTN